MDGSGKGSGDGISDKISLVGGEAEGGAGGGSGEKVRAALSSFLNFGTTSTVEAPPSSNTPTNLSTKVATGATASTRNSLGLGSSRKTRQMITSGGGHRRSPALPILAVAAALPTTTAVNSNNNR